MDLADNDVKFYINYNMLDTFTGIVAALLSDGEIYYKQFWHKPKNNWIICQ